MSNIPPSALSAIFLKAQHENIEIHKSKACVSNRKFREQNETGINDEKEL